MARMIPPQYAHTTVSAAEKKIFHLLEADPETTDWFVLHSLGLTKRATGPYGEIDFVVLLPSGAVICLEVKGGRVSCKDGIWQTIDRHGKITELKKSPFMQARDSMFGLLKAINDRFGKASDASRSLFTYAVIFCDVDPPPKTPEFEPWEAIGRTDLQTPISQIILKIVAAQRRKLSGSRVASTPASAIRDIRQFLRPDFERIITKPAIVSECETSLVSLTEDQYYVLDMISNNSRCLVEGAAGTGKTVLALEYSRRQAAIGKKVLLLCFNRLLGDWFESRTSRLAFPQLRATSYFRFLWDLISNSDYSEEFKSESQACDQEKLFGILLPFYAQLAADVAGPQFDILVVDEGQDLLTKDALAQLGGLLKGGFAGGNWYVFGDFTRQCIYGSMTRDVHLQILNSVCPHFAHASLQTNCRNTRRIGEETALLSGFSSPPYKLGRVDGLPVDYRYWDNPDQQLESLTNVVRQLLDEGMNPRDLMILSVRKFSESVASRLSCVVPKHGTISVAEIRNGTLPYNQGAALPFATVQSFKGMESPVIIFCDIEAVESDQPQALLYIGMSRARSLLIMLVHHCVRGAIASSLMRKLNEGWKT